MPGASVEALLDCIARNLEDGVAWIQIREKDLSARELADLVRRAMALLSSRGTEATNVRGGTNGLGARIIVNGRMDVALAAGAAGVHLPAESIEVGRSRAIAPAGFMIGVSCHTVDEVRWAESTGADYALFGPVFEPLSKISDLKPRGIEGLREAARAVRIPVLALGGITKENVQACVEAGAAGVAGISMFQQLSLTAT